MDASGHSIRASFASRYSADEQPYDSVAEGDEDGDSAMSGSEGSSTRHSHSYAAGSRLGEESEGEEVASVASGRVAAPVRSKPAVASDVEDDDAKSAADSEAPPKRRTSQQQLKQQPSSLRRSLPSGRASKEPSPDRRRHPSQSPTKRRSVERPAFEGDVSEWGKTQLEDFYDDDQSLSSQPTMSSGISPRDAHPRLKPFDGEAARQTLAYNAGMYGRAQAMRREGNAPAAMGIADDLPTRMAYQQLHVLAGMAGKVQDAILHNKRIFEQRMLLEDRTLLKKVFAGWRAVRYGGIVKQQKLARAVGKIMRGTMARAFYAWRDRFHLVDKNFAMKRKVSATIARGLLRRSFSEWRRLVEERWWKNQFAMRERAIAALEAKVRGYERRPVLVLRKRRLSKILNAWYALAAERRSRRMRGVKAARFFMMQQYTKAWNAWREHAEVAQRRKVLMAKTIGRVRNIKMAHAWETWAELLASKQEAQSKLGRAMKFWQKTCLSKAWNTWCEWVAWRKEKKRIMSRWMQPMKARAFSSWYEHMQWSKRMRVIVNRALGKLKHRQLSGAFQAWVEAWTDSRMDQKLASKEDMQARLKELAAENERMRRDNERFVRLIDSGEWGRGRVAEMVTAGEVLKGERDALLRLIQSLRREYEAVQHAKGAQEEELKTLKERMVVGGPARNRMLVKGGSSFNALVRAMKQDLIDSGVDKKDPKLLYEIDKLSLDRVQVYPDGELKLEALASSGSSAAFSRPINTLPGRTRAPSPGSGSPTTAMLRASGGSAAAHQHTTTTLTAHGAPNSLNGVPAAASSARGSMGGGGAPTTQRILDALQSLTPAEVDKLEAAVRQERSAACSPSVNNSASPPAQHGTGTSRHSNGGGRARVS